MRKSNIKAMIMAAGVGSRLDPLTKCVPKPLVPIANKPVMDILFEKLVAVNINEVIANTHYLAEQIIDRYKSNKLGINFNFIEEKTLSGTAGGLKKCQQFFDKNEDFLVLSADGLFDADILNGIEIHKLSGAIATIGVKKVPIEDVPNFGVVVTDENGFITAFQEKPSIKEAKSNFINTGIYVFNYKIFEYIPVDTFFDFAKNVFPKLLAEKKINTFEISEYWSDIGTLEQYKLSTQDLFNKQYKIEHAQIVTTQTGAYIADDCSIDESVIFLGNSTMGANCSIGANVVLDNCILWDNVKVSDGVKLSNCVIASGSYIHTDLNSEIVASNQSVYKQTAEIRA